MNVTPPFPIIDVEEYKKIGKSLNKEDIDTIVNIYPHPTKCAYVILRNNIDIPINYMFARKNYIEGLSHRELCEYFLTRKATNICLDLNLNVFTKFIDHFKNVYLAIRDKKIDEISDEEKDVKKFCDKWDVINFDIVNEVEDGKSIGITEEKYNFVLSISRDFNEFGQKNIVLIKDDFIDLMERLRTNVMEEVNNFKNLIEPLTFIIVGKYLISSSSPSSLKKIEFGIKLVAHDSIDLKIQNEEIDKIKKLENGELALKNFCEKVELINFSKDEVEEITNLLNDDECAKTLIFDFCENMIKSLGDNVGKVVQAQINNIFPKLNLRCYDDSDVHFLNPLEKIINDLTNGMNVEIINAKEKSEKD